MKINISKIKPHTYVSLIMVIIAIANYVLTYLGKPLIVVGEDQVTYIVNIVLNAVFILYPAWKNNSVTEKATIADEILYALRDGKISKDELEKFIAEHKNPNVPTD